MPFIIHFLTSFLFPQISYQKFFRSGENVVIMDQMRIPTLVYHNIDEMPVNVSKKNAQYHVTPEVFNEQMQYLSDQGYTPLIYADLQNIQLGKEILPLKPVILTFDDGRESQYINAYPILKKYNFKGIFYVFTNALDHQGYFSWDQLKELVNSGMEIGDHTRFHWFLDKQPQDVMVKEIRDTKKLLEDRLQIKVLSLAYPFGKYNDQVIQEVKDDGFLYARGLKHTSDISKTNQFFLGGFITQNSLSALKKILSSMY